MKGFTITRILLELDVLSYHGEYPNQHSQVMNFGTKKMADVIVLCYTPTYMNAERYFAITSPARWA
jgi:hypothetical protein